MIATLDPALVRRLTRPGDPHAAAEAEQLDDDLARAVRTTAWTRRIFYLAVLVVALYGTATGVAVTFDLPWWTAIGGVIALELGSVTFLSNADVRRRVGEHATASRLLGAAIAVAAATFNLTTHGSQLLGGFYALMSILGFASWWLDVENKRRDRLRARGMLPPPTPRYDLWGHWIRHPVTTSLARRLARTYPQLGLSGSLEAALLVRRGERRDAALTDALRTRIRAAAGRTMADIAVLTYDLGEVAHRLRATADYDGLTAVLASELTIDRMLHGRHGHPSATQAATGQPGPDSTAAVPAGRHTGFTAVPGNESAADNRQSTGRPVEQPAAGESPRAIGWAAPAPAYPPPASPVPWVLQPPDPAGPATAIGESGNGSTERLPDAAGWWTQDPNALAATGPVDVHIIGEPMIRDSTGNPVRGLRAKSLELLVYLAVQRDGAALTDILTAIWPEVEPHKAGQRLSTCLSNLRGVIRSVLDADATIGDRYPMRTIWIEPIVNTGGRYHLNPVVVTVDWWQLLDDMATHTSSPGPEPVSTTRSRIADGYDYRWLHREPGSDEPPASANQPVPASNRPDETTLEHAGR
ncbi:hypothetical protein ACQP00_21830 [Dactylosporangium sp. CS-047395]|uniref:hypothetical protein n=1 Tax=Dactylosporangium sp. CS-047395 TaxID=3239936 RepID=UPI003D8F5B13